LEPDGHAGLTFLPGQFGWLSLGQAPWRASEHPFSFSSAPSEAGSVEMTIKELGDFTKTVRHTRDGTLAYVDGPHGSFSVDLHPEAPGFFFLAGGIGIAPIVSMLRALDDRGDRRPLWLIHGSRRAERATFLEEIEALRARLDLRVTHVVQEAPEGWTGEVGLPTSELISRTLAQAPEGIHCFFCGPVPMTRMAERAVRGVGIPPWRVHLELFEMV
jgi:predicted ferric reductase